MGNEVPLEYLRHRRDLAQLGDTFRHRAVGLNDVVYALLDQPTKLMQAPVRLAARDVEGSVLTQTDQVLEIVAGQRFLQPDDAALLQLPGCLEGALIVP